MKIAVIPAYNEEEKVEMIVTETKKFVDKVILVDDGSSDRTSEIAAKSGAKVYKISKNSGKGMALRIGVGKALEAGGTELHEVQRNKRVNPGGIPP